MNCPSRTDEPPKHDGLNQNPPGLAGDLTTRQDLNGIVNTRTDQDFSTIPNDPKSQQAVEKVEAGEKIISTTHQTGIEGADDDGSPPSSNDPPSRRSPVLPTMLTALSAIRKYAKFIGPGFMVAVAYIDPGNYSTDVAAGATTRFRHLFIILMSNLFAILLQTLAVRLGSVTGMNLAENCRAHLPKWLNIFLYILGEAAIIATDIAEVIGSAIALNLLLNIPLVAGCAITLIDVLIILLFYNPDGNMRRLRAFEYFVMALVLGVVICFCIELSLIEDTSVGEVFKGYLPSSAVVNGQGIYLSCGILGATVMPHSLYLGSGIVQARLKDYESRSGITHAMKRESLDSEKLYYKPSFAAIRSCMKYSITEVAVSLFTFALFVNSAILIVAGASLSNNSAAESADLFGIHDLLKRTIAPVAGTIFALALLLSGTSAGIVCTIAGQMLSEGALNWKLAPWLRRLVTRAISITPSIIIAASIGKEGLSAALNASQVALSVALPFVSAPLIYFTSRNRFMVVGGASRGGRDNDSTSAAEEDGEAEGREGGAGRKMSNHWLISVLGCVIWLVMVIMNVALLVLVGLGKA